MSKVIKAAIWNDEACSIEAPPPPPPPQDAVPVLDAGAQARMMAEIRAKEDRANEMLKNAQIRAQILKQEAQAECEQMKKTVAHEIDAEREEAQKEGHEEGLRIGREEGEKLVREEMEDFIKKTNEKAEKTLRDAQAATRDYVQRAEEDIVSLAMAAVEKILPQHFIDVPQVVLPLVREALLKVKDQKELTVRVAPDAYDLVLMARDELRSVLIGANAELFVESDESLRPGDCVIETPNGSVDARLATQIELVRQAVKEVML
ncbi:FliH/SctL family protein [Mitsuokella sp. oral taxon 131]|uniref:FliH/SctL family protein n=1 Tax=Mitsuokella sp. oral taxon 131 TaxID=1321780 RepID=UPI0003AE78A0|nr:FliH/SctL family protein [Mitsuokella sp. oral taxon 131]ERL03601.1 flagellar assembly protein FliH [Mitsuokella sp. oral taxon 131 str. W9106]